MDASSLKTAHDNLYYTLIRHGYTVEASEMNAMNILAAPLSAAPHKEQTTQDDPGGRFISERTPPKPQEQRAVFEKSPGGVAPVLEMSRMVDHIEKSPSFNKLPPKVIKGLLKIKKLTADAFRYASDQEDSIEAFDTEAFDREAFFGGEKNPLKDLKKLLLKFDKTGPDPRKVPEEVTKAVDTLNFAVDKALSAQPKEKGILEKGMDVARGVAEKGKEVVRGVAEKGMGVARGVAEKGQQIKNDMAEKQQQKQDEIKSTTQRQEKAFNALKTTFKNYKPFKKMYYSLPHQVRSVLEDIGLGLDSLSGIATEKTAGHVNNTLLYYIRTKEAYSAKELSKGKKDEKEHLDVYEIFVNLLNKKNIKSPLTKEQFAVAIAKAHLKEDPKYYTKINKTFNKDAIDFSGIGNLITPEGKLDERELSRVIRLAIAAELDAVHLYELIVDSSDDETIKKVLQSISDEEKVHAGELQELLSKFDKDSEKFLEEGRKEVQDSSK
jgi:hypothetical protein